MTGLCAARSNRSDSCKCCWASPRSPRRSVAIPKPHSAQVFAVLFGDRERCRICSGDMVRILAAANSIADGRPSSREQMPATASLFSPGDFETRNDSRRAVGEQGDLIVFGKPTQPVQAVTRRSRQRQDTHHHFPGDIQRFATGRQDPRVRTGRQQDSASCTSWIAAPNSDADGRRAGSARIADSTRAARSLEIPCSRRSGIG